jgi:hypothetical protein
MQSPAVSPPRALGCRGGKAAAANIDVRRSGAFSLQGLKGAKIA